MRGRCKVWHDDRGFGFVSRDDGQGDVFVHVRILPFGMASLAVGNAVEFDIAPSRTKPDKFEARDVKVLG
jgi:cold shock protein